MPARADDRSSRRSWTGRSTGSTASLDERPDLLRRRPRPARSLGERAFEIVLARQIAAGEEETTWFERHGSTPITEIPAHWPADYRRARPAPDRPDRVEPEHPPDREAGVQAPLGDRAVGRAADSARCDGWLLDRLEEPELLARRAGPGRCGRSPQLADRCATTPVLRAGRASSPGNADADLGSRRRPRWSPRRPCRSSPRSATRPPGCEKRAAWEEVWALQRREDAGEKVDDRRAAEVRRRRTSEGSLLAAPGQARRPQGALRPLPGPAREGDPTPVLGWAGWDHRDQALALGRELPNQDALGAGDDALVPMVAGLVELEPWLHQWHHEVDPTRSASARRRRSAGWSTSTSSAWRRPASGSPRGPHPRRPAGVEPR